MNMRKMSLTEKLVAIRDGKPNIIITSEEADQLLSMIYDLDVNADILSKE